MLPLPVFAEEPFLATSLDWDEEDVFHSYGSARQGGYRPPPVPAAGHPEPQSHVQSQIPMSAINMAGCSSDTGRRSWGRPASRRIGSLSASDRALRLRRILGTGHDLKPPAQ